MWKIDAQTYSNEARPHSHVKKLPIENGRVK